MDNDFPESIARVRPGDLATGEAYRVNPLDRDSSRNPNERFEQQMQDKQKGKPEGDRVLTGTPPATLLSDIEDSVHISSVGKSEDKTDVPAVAGPVEKLLHASAEDDSAVSRPHIDIVA